jgi:hypothetical protein
VQETHLSRVFAVHILGSERLDDRPAEDVPVAQEDQDLARVHLAIDQP